MLDYLLTEHPCASLIAAIILTMAIVVTVVAVPAYYAQEYSCSKKASVLQTEYQFGFWEGCWVKDKSNNTWYEYTTIRNVNVEVK